MSEADLQLVAKLSEYEQQIADQATTIAGLKRALQASDDELQILLAAFRVVRKHEQ